MLSLLAAMCEDGCTIGDGIAVAAIALAAAAVLWAAITRDWS